MSYDDVEIEDMDFDPAEGMFTYPCPCGDLFQVSIGIHLSLSLSLSCFQRIDMHSHLVVVSADYD